MITKFIVDASPLLVLVLVSWSLKLLLIPAYYSTDFAVHQNWLRITHQLPLSQWYYNQQSKWTLDYPPLFAYFEYFLSIIGNTLNPTIVQTINELPQTILFQRISVIVTDLLYLWSLLKFSNSQGITFRLVLMYLWIPFIILDNIHFQYNLMMQALLIVSVGCMNRRRYLWAAFCFSLLLNFKHIYLYCAPAFFVYLLKEYVFNGNTNQENKSKDGQFFLVKLAKVGSVTLIPFFISFTPFLIVGGIQGIQQIFARLFPFSRGLVHQYWAPNFWAIYYFIDKLLVLLGLKKPNLYTISNPGQTPSLSVNILKVLPEISPGLTIIIILGLLAPIILSYFYTNKRIDFTKLVALSGFIFFMFGFHVHEKAIVPYINLLFLFADHTYYLNAATFVSIVNLVPLLVEPKQKTFCIVVCLIWIAVWDYLEQHKRDQLMKHQQKFIQEMSLENAKKMGWLYLEYFIQVSGMFVVVFQLLVHPLLRKPNLQFLPFMMNSVWAAIFNLAWIGYLYLRFVEKYGIHGRSLDNRI